MSARLAGLLALVLLAGAARAEDAGAPVTFAARSGVSFAVQTFGAGRRVVYDSGASDLVEGAWDTVLIQGDLPDPAVTFEAARADGGEPAWAALETHRFPSGRFWARARAKKGAGRLMLRAVDTGARRDHVVDVYSVEAFVDEPAAPGAPVPPARGPQDAAASRPSVHPRAFWGAVSATEPYTPDPLPWRVTLHHSDGKYTRSLQETIDEMRFIQDFHIHGRGWIDIAYHFAVDPLGDIMEGRPEGVLGAHTLGNNEGNVGIVLLGTYHPPVNDKPTAAQLAAVTALGRYLVARYGIAPSSLKGHRDYKKTECPGDVAYAQLAALRRSFAGQPPPVPALRLRRAAADISSVLAAAPEFDGESSR